MGITYFITGTFITGKTWSHGATRMSRSNMDAKEQHGDLGATWRPSINMEAKEQHGATWRATTKKQEGIPPYALGDQVS